ncbi:Uncharacterised protein [Klebsiella pneumoniae]|nr:Uncharacterised protein [Klebsiella pneumoniae]SWT48125.1 Uncharacterised protein [Klebsiella pneumoniae]SWV15549.1 Uncharacterised protein [Klebsiella pneumoniae]SWX63324.1 Uncharacterised protein [Klebsiella pneumoniae]SWX83183.1 Uncharacterised protein [Klebsiella pneumoniae]
MLRLFFICNCVFVKQIFTPLIYMSITMQNNSTFGIFIDC